MLTLNADRWSVTEAPLVTPWRANGTAVSAQLRGSRGPHLAWPAGPPRPRRNPAPMLLDGGVGDGGLAGKLAGVPGSGVAGGGGADPIPAILRLRFPVLRVVLGGRAAGALEPGQRGTAQ